jgi:hypothetical protein
MKTTAADILIDTSQDWGWRSSLGSQGMESTESWRRFGNAPTGSGSSEDPNQEKVIATLIADHVRELV